MVAMKGIIPLTTPFFLAGVRLLPAGILVLLAALWMGRPQPKTWQAWLWIGAFALVDGALFQGFLAQGLMRTGAGLGSVMIDSQPLAVALMARFLFSEQVGLLGWIGLAFGLLGISLLGIPNEWLTAIAAGETSWLSSDTLWQGLLQRGEWLMLLAALSMAVGTVMIRYVSRYADPIVATGWHMVLGGLPLFALSALGESQQWQALGWAEWSAIAYATILGSAVAYGIFFWLAAQGNLTSLSALTFLTPVFALVFGNLFLGEVLTPLQWAGVGFTLISIYFINQRSVLLSYLKQLWSSLSKQTSPSDTPS